jgi:anti-sigma regulatory factor (Ser/Thr protein kinase)
MGDQSPSWPLRSVLQLCAVPMATPCARRHARLVLREWGLDDVASTAELLVSELVTNAVTASQAMADAQAIWLRLSSDKARLLIEVWDANPLPPAPRTETLDEEDGRGLLLVMSLSERWDWRLLRESYGKVVWCELAAPEGIS